MPIEQAPNEIPIKNVETLILKLDPESLAHVKADIQKVLDENTSPDVVVERNRQILLARSKLGLAKYGTTLGDGKYSHRQILQHALEETADLLNYLQTEIMKLDGEIE